MVFAAGYGEFSDVGYSDYCLGYYYYDAVYGDSFGAYVVSVRMCVFYSVTAFGGMYFIRLYYLYCAVGLYYGL